MSLEIYDQLAQGTDEWLQARCGLVTASTIGKLITTKTLKPASNDTARDLLRTLVAERITRQVVYTWPTRDMERGTIAEPHARALYAQHYAPVTEVGFITRTTDEYQLGYSPDGLVGDDGLIEIKSPRQKTHLATIVNDQVPTQYLAQIHTGLFVTGRKWIDFISYHPGMPLYVKRVTPSEEWAHAIHATMLRFEAEASALLAAYTARSRAYYPAPFIDLDAEMDIH